MRVVAGEFKGRQVKAVPGKTTRPTSDKVKEAVFQVMGPYFEGGACLDLFAGSGSLGIEALSRGMDRVVFVDKHPAAIHTIHENLRALKLQDVTEVFRTDAIRALHAAAKRGLQFDLILIDPPYAKAVYEQILDEIAALDLARKDAIIYCEHGTSEPLPPAHEHFDLLKQGNYGGTTKVTMYRRAQGGN